MGNIVLLDELTINKIAAGEVIERPASVVKEMAENSLDAGATSINIEIQNGGIRMIRITDNGKGIAPDDMRIAFERHATSKIRVADDLLTVRTMGFRGEALASIAAIARVEMVSRTKDTENGNRIIVEGGKIIKEEPCGAPIGTTITVENLFYNTPVRYKFLKKDYTEAGYIEDMVTRLALVNPSVAIKLVSSGKTILATHGTGDIKNVIYQIYGKDVSKGVLDVNYEYDGIRVNGVVGKPEIARGNRIYQQFFVNNRYVRDKVLSSAVDQAYKGMIPIGKFAFVILNIQMSPEKVDVNVHPAKLEIRFQEENNVFKAVMYAVKETLLQGQLIKNVSKPETSQYVSKINLTNERFKPNQETMQNNFFEKKSQTIADIYKKISENEKENSVINVVAAADSLPNMGAEHNIEQNTDTTVSFVSENVDKTMSENIDGIENQENIRINPNVSGTNTSIFQGMPQSNVNVASIDAAVNIPTSNNAPNYTYGKRFLGVQEDSEQYKNEEFEEMYEKTFGDIPASMKQKEEKFNGIKFAENVSFFDKNQKYANYKFVGSAFATYIILEIEDELYIIDQHAAHERIMYEKVKKNFYSEEKKDSQLMLVPDVINLSHKEMLIARENLDIFRKAGFVVDEFGETTIKLSGVPDVCIDLDTKSLFLDILDEIDTVARTERQEKEEKFIATVACKSAVKANNMLTEPEVRSLMDRLLQLPNPFTCPHGRPTAIKMSKADFERKFNRR